MSFAVAADAVAEGALLLDNIDPDWFKKIDVGNLDLASGTFCVLGQLYGSYDEGIDRIPDLAVHNTHHWGFQLGPYIESYSMLTPAWLREIMMRRNPPVVKIMEQTLAEEAKEGELVPA